MQALTSGDGNLVHGAMRVLTGRFNYLRIATRHLSYTLIYKGDVYIGEILQRTEYMYLPYM